MIHDILLAIWFLLPAALANATPIFAARIPFLSKWDTPMDGGRTFRGKRIFGDHKTWRGLVTGMIVATIVLWVQQLIVMQTNWVDWFTASVPYETLPVLLLGPVFAIGALGGDAIESFFKRAIGIKSGKPWFPFDQLDYIIGAVLVSLFFVILSPLQYVLIFVIWFVGHLLASFIGYLLGLKKEPI